MPAVDIRSQVRAARALATCLTVVGRLDEADKAQKRAAALAYSTQQVSERGELLPSST